MHIARARRAGNASSWLPPSPQLSSSPRPRSPRARTQGTATSWLAPRHSSSSRRVTRRVAGAPLLSPALRPPPWSRRRGRPRASIRRCPAYDRRRACGDRGRGYCRLCIVLAYLRGGAISGCVPGAARKAPSELLHRTEEEWIELAASSARFRGSGGAIETAFGGLLAVAGGVLLLAPPIGGIEQNKQYSIDSILIGSGVPFLSLGLHALFIKSPEETAGPPIVPAAPRAPRRACRSASLRSSQAAPSRRATF
jgi:hypothetical protein